MLDFLEVYLNRKSSKIQYTPGISHIYTCRSDQRSTNSKHLVNIAFIILMNRELQVFA